MNSFKILGSADWHKITVTNYETLTHKKYPYYQEVKNTISHFAICPACGNPITIVNLYPSKDSEDSIYGRHHKFNVKDIADYSQDAYNTCPLSKPTSFTTRQARIDISKANEIFETIEEYKNIIYSCMKVLSGINLSMKKLDAMLDVFKKENGLNLIFVNKYNLPYAILYLSNNQNIYGQFVWDAELKEAINDSRYFQISSEGKIEKKPDVDLFSSIELFFTVVSEQSLQLIVNEITKERTNKIFSKNIKIDMEYFFNKIPQNNN